MSSMKKSLVRRLILVLGASLLVGAVHAGEVDLF